MKQAAFAIPIILLGSIFIFGWRQAPQQTPPFGYIRSGELMAKATLAIKAREEIDRIKEEAKSQIRELEIQLSQDHESFLKEQANLDEATLTERMAALRDQEKNLVRFREAKWQSISRVEQEQMAPVLEIINSRLAEFAKKEALAMIWGTLSQGNILYAEEDLDVTAAAIEFVNAAP